MQPLTPAEIDVAEAAIGVRLPALYRQVLAEVGVGCRGACEVYHPATVRKRFEPFYRDIDWLYAPYFPFGEDRRLQTIWVIDASRSVAASLWHERLPDEWCEDLGEGEDWLPYAEWWLLHLPRLTYADPNATADGGGR